MDGLDSNEVARLPMFLRPESGPYGSGTGGCQGIPPPWSWPADEVVGDSPGGAMREVKRSLCIVSPRYGHEIVGGAETVARLLAEELVTRGWQVSVWTSCAVSADTWENVLAPGESEAYGVRVVRFPAAFPRNPVWFSRMSRLFFRLPAALRPEQFWLKRQGPYLPGLVEAICRQDTSGASPFLFLPYLFYPTLAGLPAAVGSRVQSLLMPAAHDERPLRLRSVRDVFRKADALWYATPEEQQLVERVYPEVAPGRSAVGTVGIRGQKGDPERFCAGYQLSGPYLLAGGRLTPGKGVDSMLFDALRLARGAGSNISLVVTGEGAPSGIDGVLPVGVLSRQGWWDAVAGAAAVVIPSSQESLSLVALEAWISGRPTIANAASPVLVGQTRRSGGGVLFSSIPELVSRIQAAAANREAMEAMGKAGQQFVREQYGWDRVVENLELLLGTGADDSRPALHSREVAADPARARDEGGGSVRRTPGERGAAQ